MMQVGGCGCPLRRGSLPTASDALVSLRSIGEDAGVSSGQVVASWWPAREDSAEVHSVGLGGFKGHDGDTEVKVGQRHRVGHRIMGLRLSTP